MSYIAAALRQLVIQRAAGHCEYCGLSQEGQEATFHIDHVIPKAAGGETVAENLALACVSCSLRKAARQTAVDAQSGKEVALYNPRRDTWHEPKLRACEANSVAGYLHIGSDSDWAGYD